MSLGDLISRCSKIWDDVRQSPAIQPTRHAILPDHLDKPLGESFKFDQHYFLVSVNESYLTYSRQWGTTYVPMVLVITEFQYNGNRTAVPFTIGPSLIEGDKSIKVPDTGMIFSNTRVAGIHPYTGDRIALTVILYRLTRTKYVDKLLQIAENAAGALDFSTALSGYLKIANVLMDVVEALLGDAGQTEPLVGLRSEFDPDRGMAFEPGYFVLINKPGVEQHKLWVQEDKLLYGDSAETAQPYRDADYVLYSIGQTTERSDYKSLPFYQVWKQAIAESISRSADKWENALKNWTVLYQTMSLSPDLIPSQVEALADECREVMDAKHNKVLSRGGMGTEAGHSPPLPADDEDRELQIISRRLDSVRGKSVPAEG
jgi:hypothetical protein